MVCLFCVYVRRVCVTRDWPRNGQSKLCSSCVPCLNILQQDTTSLNHLIVNVPVFVYLEFEFACVCILNGSGSGMMCDNFSNCDSSVSLAFSLFLLCSMIFFGVSQREVNKPNISILSLSAEVNDATHHVPNVFLRFDYELNSF